jgi:hypothetical protein
MEVANTNSKADDMARISYDEQTAAAFKAVREVPRDGLSEWRGALRRHLRPSRGMTLVDIGAGTGAFAAAFSDWFDLSVLAISPRTSPAAVKNVSAVPYDMPRTQRTRKPEAIGLTSWFCADRFAQGEYSLIPDVELRLPNIGREGGHLLSQH